VGLSVIALSFSGGKDSSLALYELQKEGKHVSCLFTTVSKEDGKTIAHDAAISELEEQAERLGLPIYFIETTFSTYAEDFVRMLKKLKEEYSLTAVAFGDWYLKDHRQWSETQAIEAGLEALYPLWSPQSLMIDKLDYFVELGFQAKIIKVDESKLPKSWLGKIIDKHLIDELASYGGICPMGENGEYHTTVIEGPIYVK